MDRRIVPTIARRLMTTHGVGYLQFGYHSYPAHPIEKMGQTHFWKPKGYPYLPSKITVSYDWIPYLTETELVELVKHEIAHAKAGHGTGHGEKWREHCFRLGIEPRIKYNPINTPDHFIEWMENG